MWKAEDPWLVSDPWSGFIKSSVGVQGEQEKSVAISLHGNTLYFHDQALVERRMERVLEQKLQVASRAGHGWRSKAAFKKQFRDEAVVVSLERPVAQLAPETAKVCETNDSDVEMIDSIVSDRLELLRPVLHAQTVKALATKNKHSQSERHCRERSCVSCKCS